VERSAADWSDRSPSRGPRKFLAGNIGDDHSQSRGRKRDQIVKISANFLGRGIPGIQFETRDMGSGARKEHVLNATRHGQIEIELLFLNLQVEELGVVQGDGGLFGERGNQDKID